MVEGPNQDKSTVSCVNRRVAHTLKPEQYCPGYSRGMLSVVKHRQCFHGMGWTSPSLHREESLELQPPPDTTAITWHLIVRCCLLRRSLHRVNLLEISLDGKEPPPGRLMSGP